MFGEHVVSGLAHWRRRALETLWIRARLLWFLFPLSLFIAMRLWLSFWAAFITFRVPPPVSQMQALYYGIRPFVSGLDSLLWGPWQRWDTMWYLKIAERGYSTQDVSTAFFPLYPLLIKLAAPFFADNDTAAAVIVASVAALTSFVLLYRLAADQYGVAVTRRTLWLLAAFPTAFFLFAGYPEPLFLALALGSLLAARAGRWGLASLLGGLVALTRPQGTLYLFVLVTEFVLQFHEHRVLLKQAVWLSLTALGAAAYPLYLWLQFGNPLIWFQVERWWHHLMLPWDTLLAGWNVIIGAKSWSQLGYALPDLLFALCYIGLLLWSVARLRPTLAVYMAIIILPPLFSLSTFQPLFPIASMCRYVLVAFPGLLLLGSSQRIGRWLFPMVILSLIVQTIILSQFLEWHFIA